MLQFSFLLSYVKLNYLKTKIRVVLCVTPSPTFYSTFPSFLGLQDMKQNTHTVLKSMKDREAWWDVVLLSVSELCSPAPLRQQWAGSSLGNVHKRSSMKPLLLRETNTLEVSLLCKGVCFGGPWACVGLSQTAQQSLQWWGSHRQGIRCKLLNLTSKIAVMQPCSFPLKGNCSYLCNKLQVVSATSILVVYGQQGILHTPRTQLSSVFWPEEHRVLLCFALSSLAFPCLALLCLPLLFFAFRPGHFLNA